MTVAQETQLMGHDESQQGLLHHPSFCHMSWTPLKMLPPFSEASSLLEKLVGRDENNPELLDGG